MFQDATNEGAQASQLGSHGCPRRAGIIVDDDTKKRDGPTVFPGSDVAGILPAVGGIIAPHPVAHTGLFRRGLEGAPDNAGGGSMASAIVLTAASTRSEGDHPPTWRVRTPANPPRSRKYTLPGSSPGPATQSVPMVASIETVDATINVVPAAGRGDGMGTRGARGPTGAHAVPA